MKTENLSTLKIHQLSQKQYDRELAAGRIDENAIYLTPYEGTFVTKEYVDSQRIAWDNSFSVTWDGNTEGLASVSTMQNIVHYQISDEPIDFSLINGGTLGFTGVDTGTEFLTISIEKNYLGYNLDVLLATVKDVAEILPVAINAYEYIEAFNAPKGLYFGKFSDAFYTKSIDCIDLHTIDPKYIPDTYATKDELNTLASQISSLNTSLENTLEGVDS